MRATLCAVLLGIGVLLTGAPLFAHHAFTAEFNSDKPETLKGTVTKLVWNNPHAWIHVDVKDPDGKVVEWAVEAGSPNALVRRGWRKDSLPIGSEVVIEGFVAKDGTPTLNARNITFPDGRKLFAGSADTGAPEEPTPAR